MNLPEAHFTVSFWMISEVILSFYLKGNKNHLIPFIMLREGSSINYSEHFWKILFIDIKVMEKVRMDVTSHFLSFVSLLVKATISSAMCPARSCKRSEILFQISLLLFLTWTEYFYSQPTHFSSQPKK